jgi:hypothetical protein
MPKAKPRPKRKRPPYEELRKALVECEEILAMSIRLHVTDPMVDPAVKVLSDHFGGAFGAIMASASRQWREYLTNYQIGDEKVDLRGGEFVCGPCRGTVESLLAQVRKALGRKQ